MLTHVIDWAASFVEALRRACHPAQLDAATDPHALVSVLCPRGAGKTTAAEVRLLETMLTKARARCIFVTDTREHAAGICWDKFKEIIARLGVEATFSQVARVITIVKNGSTLTLAGADDRAAIEKFRGIPYDGVVVDESASWPAQILEWFLDRGIIPRIGERDGWVMMIGTPGHRRAGPFYDATRPGGPTHRPFAERDDPAWADEEREWSSHHWTLGEAALHVAAAAKLWAAALHRKQVKGWADTNPVWMREYLGLWAADDTDMMYRYRPHLDDGAAWNEWDPAKAGAMLVATLPPDVADDAMFVYAFDKGFKDNFATNVFAFSPMDPRRRIFHVYGAEAPGMSCRTFARLLLGSREDSPDDPNEASDPQGLIGATGWPAGIVGDVDGGFLKDLAEVYGVRAAKADKKLESKVTTIEEINGDLAEGRILVLKGSRLAEQLVALQWVPDEYGGVKEDKSQANHSSDTLVYARRVIAPMFQNVAAEREEPKPKARPAPPLPTSAAGKGFRPLLASGTYKAPPW